MLGDKLTKNEKAVTKAVQSVESVLSVFTDILTKLKQQKAVLSETYSENVAIIDKANDMNNYIAEEVKKIDAVTEKIENLVGPQG